MEPHKNQQPDVKNNEQNTPLNNPVSHSEGDEKTTRSSTNDELDGEQKNDGNLQGDASIPLGNQDTIGNP